MKELKGWWWWWGCVVWLKNPQWEKEKKRREERRWDAGFCFQTSSKSWWDSFSCLPSCPLQQLTTHTTLTHTHHSELLTPTFCQANTYASEASVHRCRMVFVLFSEQCIYLWSPVGTEACIVSNHCSILAVIKNSVNQSSNLNRTGGLQRFVWRAAEWQLRSTLSMRTQWGMYLSLKIG